MTTLQLSNSANWEPFWTATFNGVRVTPQTVAPIGEKLNPILLDKHILAVYVDSNSAKSTWYFAGFLSQRMQLGLTVGGLPDTNGYTRRKVWLRKMTLITFPKLTSEYALAFTPPDWFEDVSINVWKYIGPEPLPTQQLIENLQQDLSRIESKIDELL